MGDVQQGIARYSAFFHREPDSLLTSSLPDGAEVVVARFPLLKGGFFKRAFAALPEGTVWITSGMSLCDMNVLSDSKLDRRIELSAYVPDAAYFGGDIGQDLIAELLLVLAAYPFAENTPIGPCHTISFPDPLFAETKMSSVFLGVLPVDMPRLCSCTPGKATFVASVVPITAERDWYASKSDLVAMLDLFEENDVELHFDLRRPSLV